MTNDIDHLFVYLFSIYIPFWWDFCFHFLIQLLVFLFVEFLRVICIFWMQVLFRYVFCKYFSWSVSAINGVEFNLLILCEGFLNYIYERYWFIIFLSCNFFFLSLLVGFGIRVMLVSKNALGSVLHLYSERDYGELV